jgi:hypothetical protein
MFEQPVGNLGRGIINLIKNESEMIQKANVANVTKDVARTICWEILKFGG